MRVKRNFCEKVKKWKGGKCPLLAIGHLLMAKGQKSKANSQTA